MTHQPKHSARPTPPGTLVARILELIAQPGADVAVQAPGDDEGFWAGGPSTVWDDGVFYLAYRLRRPVDRGRGFANVVARSTDGVRFETLATVPTELFDAASLERPALVRRPDGGWRLYVSCSTHGSKHWWVEALDADTPDALADGVRTVVLAGDESSAWKDVVVHRDDDGWHMWACRHPLDDGDDEADRMTSVYLTSTDGLRWSEESVALAPIAGAWNARGTRITSVLPGEFGWEATYDGRASKAENWFERTGIAVGASPKRLEALGGPTPAGRTIRYVSVATTPRAYRVYWEASRGPGAANDLLTATLPR